MSVIRLILPIFHEIESGISTFHFSNDLAFLPYSLFIKIGKSSIISGVSNLIWIWFEKKCVRTDFKMLDRLDQVLLTDFLMCFA